MEKERTKFLKQHSSLIAEQGWGIFENLPHQSLFIKGTPDAIKFLAQTSREKAALIVAKNSALPIRERIHRGVCSYLHAQLQWGGIPLMRKTRSWLAMPHHLRIAQSTLYETSHAIWKAAGDASLDSNFYSKRILAMGVLLSSELALIAQEDPHYDIEPFVTRRIQNILFLGSFLRKNHSKT